jgi:hypothetical protein
VNDEVKAIRRWGKPLRILVVVRVVAFVGAIGSCLWENFLTVYLTTHRSHVPEPAKGWTVRLKWSLKYPTYGSADDYARMELAFYCLVACVVIATTCAVIMRFMKKERPKYETMEALRRFWENEER